MQIETLSDAWAYSLTVTMQCAHGKQDGMKTIRECTFRKELDMETLLCTRGRDFPIARLAECLRCPRCGSRRVRVIWRVPSQGDEKRNAVGF